MKLLSVVGTRPNFMKLAPVARVLESRGVDHVVVHTGQHYDGDMSAIFFHELGLTAPNYHLGIGSDTAPRQVAMVLERLGPILTTESPDMVVVYGDVTSTMAAALGSAQRRFPVAHVEAGLRSRDRSMPEELNRIVTDHVSDLLLCPSLDAVENLRLEGISAHAIRFAGNVMIDTVVVALPEARKRRAAERLGVARGDYVLVTLHRPSNVDDAERLPDLLAALTTVARDRDVIFPMHPRTRHRIAALNLELPRKTRLQMVDPVGYVDMLSLVSDAALVITDSGGLQEETTFLGVPCLTVRENTERPITVTHGTNRLVAPNGEALLEAAAWTLANPRADSRSIERWDGHAAERCVDAMAVFVGGSPESPADRKLELVTG
jgi:UDP-N-acetylglucosamine 2-epimerase (non-hydrolysing)